MQIWDTAGQERFRTITQTYYKGANGIILAYDANDDTSFNNIKNWIKQIEAHATPGVAKILLGNKCDIPNRKISTEKGKALAAEFGLPFFETSAKSGANIKEAFHFIAKEIKDRQPANLIINPISKLNEGKSKDPKTPQESGCCK